jgi:4-amino-4-deoxy-L-arabinose transferase-like glycosyltransferase
VFSFMGGVVHSYYSVSLAPGIAATVAVSVRELWRKREQWPSRAVLAVMVAVTGVWGWVLLGRAAPWHPELRWIVAAATVLGAVGFLTMTLGNGTIRRVALTVTGIAAVTVAALPSAAYSLQTASTGHSGSIPVAGPDGAGDGRAGGDRSGGGQATGRPGRGSPRTEGQLPGDPRPNRNGASPPRAPSGGVAQGRPGIGSRSAQDTGSTKIVSMLEMTTTTWAAAIVGSQVAAPLELSSGKSVIAIGGFSGGDGGPTLETFQQWVAGGKVSYFLIEGSGAGPGGGGRVPGGGTSAGSEITAWVVENHTATTIDSWMVYDLTSTAS